MSRFWTISLLCLQIMPSSFAVVLSPCKVNNIQTQPLYGTSLRTKTVVQIIQIPPVFTQNVLVGKCVNQNQDTAGSPNEYFVCRQRYSAVEVYVTNEELYSNPNQNGPHSQEPATQILKRTNFIRDSVVVESGCDFTFNLLPLLLGQRKDNMDTAPTGEEQFKHHFLKSPYHAVHPNANLFQPQSVARQDDHSHGESQPYDQGGNEIHSADEYQNSKLYEGYQPQFSANIVAPSSQSGQSQSDDYQRKQNILWQRLQSHVNGEHRYSFQTLSTKGQGSISRPTYTTEIESQQPGSSNLGYEKVTGQNLLAGSTYETVRERAEDNNNDDNNSGNSGAQLVDPSVYSNGTVDKPYNISSSGNFSSLYPQHLESVPVNGTSSYKPVNISTNSGDGGIISISYPVLSNNTSTVNGTNSSQPLSVGYLSTKEFSSGGKEKDLYHEPQPVGLPLRILSRRFDTLMNNVDTEGTPLYY